MNGLSFGVIRVNTEDKNSALTVQDVGHVMPGGKNGQEARVRRFWGCLGAERVNVLSRISLGAGQVGQRQTQSFLSRLNVSVLTRGKVWELL